MGNIFQASNPNELVVSDEADRQMFRSLCTGLIEEIIRVKHNDPEVSSLSLTGIRELDESGWTRLGYILGRNTTIVSLCMIYNLDMQGLYAGLQNNCHIRELDMFRVDLQDTQKLSSLAPFLRGNPNLRVINLCGCGIGLGGLNVLVDALSDLSNLEELSLRDNSFGDIYLDELVLMLKRNMYLHHLDLSRNEIGIRGCTSLAKLLRHDGCNLNTLFLWYKSIDNECAIMLAESLANNNKLKKLILYGNPGITQPGWSAILNLVCNTSSLDDVMKSNHTLSNVDMSCQALMKMVGPTLGVANANLLRASLKVNKNQNKMFVARRKMLWGHVRGDLNIGDSPIPTAAIPAILAWIGDDSDETNASLIQYHDPPLPPARTDTTRLNAIYRIIQSRPGLVSSRSGVEHKNDTSPKEQLCHKRKACELDGERI